VGSREATASRLNNINSRNPKTKRGESVRPAISSTLEDAMTLIRCWLNHCCAAELMVRWRTADRLANVRAPGLWAVLLASLMASISSAQAQTYTIMHSFTASTDGSNAQIGMVSQGIVYGTAFLDGNTSCSCGTVFQVSGSGFQVLHAFIGTDGANPVAGLVMDGSGNLYGATGQGGSGSGGEGTVFELVPSGSGTWTESVLHTFTGGSDGAHPFSGPVEDNAGNLYGTTNRGGASDDGTIYKIDSSGNETVLYSFGGSPDGAYPYGALIMDSSGNLYGTTGEGGTSNLGAVFEFSTAGQLTVLHSFTGGEQGAYPNGALLFDSSGNLYGTTNEGGLGNHGTVFKIDSSNNFSVLYEFHGEKNGFSPESALVTDGQGNFYGTSNEGGDADKDGTIFKLTAAGVESILYEFPAGGAGAYPYSGVVMDASGNLYGATINGGHTNSGVVYKLTF